MKSVYIISERNSSRKNMEPNVIGSEQGDGGGGSEKAGVSRDLEVKKELALCIARKRSFQAEAWSGEGVRAFVEQKVGHGGWVCNVT